MRELRTTGGPTPTRHRRVTKAPHDRRQDILRAGLELFRTTGYNETTIAEIATRAEIAKGTFYLYFDSKDELLGALWQVYIEELVRKATGVLAGGEDWWPTLDQLWATLIDHAAEHAELHRIVYGSANGRARELCQATSQRLIDLVGIYVRRGAEAGAFLGADVELNARLVYLAAEGLLDEAGRERRRVDPAPITAAVQNLCHLALGDPPAAVH